MKDLQSVEFTEVEDNKGQNGTTLISNYDNSVLKGVNVELDCVVGDTVISLEKLYSLKIGEVISLNQNTHDEIKLLLNGHHIASGHLVASNGKFGVEITQVPELNDE